MVIPLTNNNDHRREEHDKILKDVGLRMPDENTAHEMSELFKVLSDPTRLKILWTMKDGDICVCCISDILGMSVSAVSHQLKTLRQAHLVKTRRDGRNIYYSLDDHHVRTLLDITLEHMRE
ncbi:MAG: metalloregulator ArsR/SmtB family transcription factor [Candidatus Methanoplasma sp.]|jgi:ArsR family transcriptional regulator|nr:metalloregulator ArsR/SmtB family transcription factor [Candidatus Methanoplasma sp.]